MASTTIKYKLEVDSKSISELESDFSALRDKLDVTPRGTAEWKKLQTQVVGLDSKLKNIRKSVEGIDMEALAGEAGKFAGGIGAMTGAMVLFGDESDDTMQELQANMNKGIGIMMASKGAVEAWTSGTKLLKAANVQLNATMLLNPVGLIVAGVLALGAAITILALNYDKLTGSYDGAAEAAEKLEDINKKAIETYQEQKISLIDIGIQLDNTTGEDRRDAIDGINKKYKTQIGYLDSTEEALKKISTAMLQQIKLEAVREELIALYKEQNEALNDLKEGGSVWNTILFGTGVASLKAANEYKSLGDEIVVLEEKYSDLTEEQLENEIATKNNTDATNKNTEAIKKNAALRAEIYANSFKLENYIADAIISRTKLTEESEKIITEATESALKIRRDKENERYKQAKKDLIKFNEDQLILKNLEAINDFKLGVKTEEEKNETIQKNIKERDKLNKEGLALLKEATLLVHQGIASDELVIYEKKEEKKKAIRIKYGLEEADAKADELIDLEKSYFDGLIDYQQYLEAKKNLDKKYSDIKRIENLNDASFIIDTFDNMFTSLAELELSLTEGTEEEKKRIKKKYALINATVAIAQIGVQTALAMVRALAELGPIGGPIAGVAIGITGLAQAGLAIAEYGKIQQLRNGGLLPDSLPSHEQGGVRIAPGYEAEGGEYITSRKAMKSFAPIVAEINDAGNSGRTPQIIDYDKLATKLGQVVNDKKVFVTDRDISKEQGNSVKVKNRSSY